VFNEAGVEPSSRNRFYSVAVKTMLLTLSATLPTICSILGEE